MGKTAADVLRVPMLGPGLVGADHDSDAVFVSAQAAEISLVVHGDQSAAAWRITVLAAIATYVDSLPASRHSSPRWHPPDKILDASGSNLILRNLRI